jgi:hypothetical protein
LTGIRRVEIEPGCSLHIFQEAEAHSAAQFLSEKFNFEVCIFPRYNLSLMLLILLIL